MDLSDLITSLDPCNKTNNGFSNSKVCFDSRVLEPGDIFVAIAGGSTDGHDFIAEAIKRGAAIIVTQKNIAAAQNVQMVTVQDTAYALAVLAQAAQGNPAKGLTMLGVTGTNGKTTVAYLTQAMLNTGGIPAGMIGTVAYDTGAGDKIPANNTTPDAVRLAEMMASMCRCGRKAMVMECSSHGLDQQRTAAIEFKAAAFTNLTGDHLDYHGTSQAYLDAKAKLFEPLSGDAVAVLNGQDQASAKLAKRTKANLWYYEVTNGKSSAQISANVKDMGLWGCDLRLNLLGESVDLRFTLPGEHNVSNLLAAAGLAHAGGVSLEAIAEAARSFTGVPGRLQRVDAGQDFTVLVDYAHTDDALANVLKAICQLNPKRMILVFGCGGDRDKTKRPRMAKVAQQYCQEIIVTNDNPRTEEPQRIAEDIFAGFDDGCKTANIQKILDRRSAIARAVEMADPGDAVLIAGKGHEDYQIIGRERLDFDDRVVALELLKKTRPAATDNNVDNSITTSGASKRQPKV